MIPEGSCSSPNKHTSGVEVGLSIPILAVEQGKVVTLYESEATQLTRHQILLFSSLPNCSPTFQLPDLENRASIS